MPRFTGSFGLPNLDELAARRALGAELKDILFEGTVEWVRTVSAILPNWSGMSRASLQSIGNLVGILIFASPVLGAPDRVAQGRNQGEGRFSTSADERAGQYFFEWRSQVFHLIYNESNDANAVGFHLRNPGPYHSQRQAQQSFFKTVNPRLRDLQFDLGAHIKITRRIVR